MEKQLKEMNYSVIIIMKLRNLYQRKPRNLSRKLLKQTIQVVDDREFPSNKTEGTHLVPKNKETDRVLKTTFDI